MTTEARQELLERAMNLMREHCSNVVIVSAWMSETGAYDDKVVINCHGSLHGCMGALDVAAGQLGEIMADRYESGKEDE